MWVSPTWLTLSAALSLCFSCSSLNGFSENFIQPLTGHHVKRSSLSHYVNPKTSFSVNILILINNKTKKKTVGSIPCLVLVNVYYRRERSPFQPTTGLSLSKAVFIDGHFQFISAFWAMINLDFIFACPTPKQNLIRAYTETIVTAHLHCLL